MTASLLILVQPSSSGRASPSVCLEMQYRLPPGSHLAAAVHLPLSVQRQYRLPNGSHLAAFAPLPPVVQQQSCPRRLLYGGLILVQPSSSCRASPSVCADAVPVASRQLSSEKQPVLRLSLCTDRERESRNRCCWMASREVTITADAQTERERGAAAAGR